MLNSPTPRSTATSISPPAVVKSLSIIPSSVIVEPVTVCRSVITSVSWPAAAFNRTWTTTAESADAAWLSVPFVAVALLVVQCIEVDRARFLKRSRKTAGDGYDLRWIWNALRQLEKGFFAITFGQRLVAFLSLLSTARQLLFSDFLLLLKSLEICHLDDVPLSCFPVFRRIWSRSRSRWRPVPEVSSSLNCPTWSGHRNTLLRPSKAAAAVLIGILSISAQQKLVGNFWNFRWIDLGDGHHGIEHFVVWLELTFLSWFWSWMVKEKIIEEFRTEIWKFFDRKSKIWQKIEFRETMCQKSDRKMIFLRQSFKNLTENWISLRQGVKKLTAKWFFYESVKNLTVNWFCYDNLSKI